MKRIQTLNNLKGQGRPKIAVPITGTDADTIVDQCEAAFEVGCDILEWRVDYFLRGLEDLNQALEDETVHLEIVRILDDIDYVTDGTPVIFTIRSEAQGGVITLDEDVAYDLQSLAAQSELVDFVDIELFDKNDSLDEEALTNQIKNIQEFDTCVILSYHDFEGAPTEEQIYNIVSLMRELGADICKIAGTVDSKEGAVSILKATATVNKKEGSPAIILAMGKEGIITRVVGGKYGSCITFAAGANATAPGQVSLKKMKELLDKYYEE